MTFQQFFRVVEIRTKIVSVSSFLLALIWILRQQGQANPLLALLFFAAMLMVDMGTTGFNTFYDYMNGTDDKKFNREADKVLVYQGVSPGASLLISLGLFLGAAIVGGILAFLTSWDVVLWGAISMAIGFLYNGGPLPLSRTPLGEFFAGGFLGTVMMMILGIVLLGRMDPRLFWATVPSALMIASILTVNNTCDRLGDKEAGRLTLTILIGPTASKVLILLFWLGSQAYVGYQVFESPSVWAVGWGLSLIPQVLELVTLYRRGFSHETKGPNMGSISKIFMFYTLGYAFLIGL